jgi:hypothetical protein
MFRHSRSSSTITIAILFCFCEDITDSGYVKLVEYILKRSHCSYDFKPNFFNFICLAPMDYQTKVNENVCLTAVLFFEFYKNLLPERCTYLEDLLPYLISDLKLSGASVIHKCCS